MALRNRPGTERFGFTLIELLVVISIITLLISVLLPALRGARQSAQMARCMANTRQLGIAIATYMQDFEQTFPPNYFYRANGTIFVDGEDVAYVGTIGSATPYHNPRFHHLNRYLTTIVTNTEPMLIGRCPSDDTLSSNIGGYRYNGTSYISNTNMNFLRNIKIAEGLLTDKATYHRGIRESDIKNPPAEFPTMMETGAKYTFNGDTIGLRPWLRFHTANQVENKFMTVFADGHSALILYGTSVFAGEGYNLERD